MTNELEVWLDESDETWHVFRGDRAVASFFSEEEAEEYAKTH